MSNSLLIRTLPWDSDFFHLRIGRVDVHAATDWELLREMVESGQAPFDLLYVFSDAELPAPLPAARRVDTKVVYRKMVSPAEPSEDGHILEFEGTVPDAELYRLALVSGRYSRFNVDERFPEGSYERLYRRWIENSVNGLCAETVLCYVEGDSTLGFVTLGMNAGEGEIGLIAVDPHWQGHGIGAKLIRAAERRLQARGVDSLEVATQQDNTTACHFYEKCGFVKKSGTDIYHLWI